ncbi:unnamed protein product, partial [Musa textilis]
LLTPVLQYKSPFEKLFHKPPNFHKLKVFGCLCYPYLRPYASHKLTPRSKPCIFIGYSLEYNAFRCYEPHTQKVFLSRHVIFVESSFPFQNHEYSTMQATSTNTHHWSISSTPSHEPPTTPSNPNPPDQYTPPVQHLLPIPPIPSSQVSPINEPIPSATSSGVVEVQQTSPLDLNASPPTMPTTQPTTSVAPSHHMITRS